MNAFIQLQNTLSGRLNFSTLLPGRFKTAANQVKDPWSEYILWCSVSMMSCPQWSFHPTDVALSKVIHYPPSSGPPHRHRFARSQHPSAVGWWAATVGFPRNPGLQCLGRLTSRCRPHGDFPAGSPEKQDSLHNGKEREVMRRSPSRLTAQVEAEWNSPLSTFLSFLFWVFSTSWFKAN